MALEHPDHVWPRERGLMDEPLDYENDPFFKVRREPTTMKFDKPETQEIEFDDPAKGDIFWDNGSLLED